MKTLNRDFSTVTRDASAIDYMRSIKHIFMHRPYRRMPETGWAIAYLFALAEGHETDRQELQAYAEAAGVDIQALRAEIGGTPDVAALANCAIVRTVKEAVARFINGQCGLVSQAGIH